MPTKPKGKKIDQPTPAEVKEVLRLRKDAVPWLDIIARMKKPRAFILAVRPLMKKADPKSVGQMGPAYSGRKKGPKSKDRGEPRLSPSIKKKSLLEEIWNPKTSDERIIDILMGRKIEVTYELDGKKIQPVQYEVMKIRKILPARSGARAVDFIDVEQSFRAIRLNNISAIR